MRFLAVDTDLSALDSLAACLQKIFPQDKIAIFSDPLLAVKYGYSHEIDAVFTEIDMKGLSGFDLVRLIRAKQSARTAVYFVSANENTRIDALRFMADGFIVKPTTADALREAVQAPKAELAE